MHGSFVSHCEFQVCPQVLQVQLNRKPLNDEYWVVDAFGMKV
jgi:hypothetical protein